MKVAGSTIGFKEAEAVCRGMMPAGRGPDDAEPRKQMRILFVDDEAPILESLRDLLRKERRRWHMVFAEGAQQALEELSKSSFDLVVSDMRMPVMDGVELLAIVKRDHPGAARIILSGHAERDVVIRSVSVAHQFLGKPCTAEALRAAIERTCSLNQMLQGNPVRALISQLSNLPSLPEAYFQLVRAAADPATSVNDIAAIVQRDPAMSAKILQLVNSSYFREASTVTSVRHAVSFLGIDLIKGLALASHTFDMKHTACPLSFEKQQKLSVLTARIAKAILPDSKRTDDAFTAAILLDIGRFAIGVALPDCYDRVVLEASRSKRCYSEIELELLGTTHAEIGAYLLGIWGLPFSIVETVAYHDRVDVLPEGPCDLLAAVHAASVFAETALSSSGDLEHQPAELNLPFLERAGVSGLLDSWRQTASEIAESEFRHSAV